MVIPRFNNRFARGSGCYVCSSCGKRTRKTGDGASVGLCEGCYSEAGLENEHSDGGHAPGTESGCPACHGKGWAYAPGDAIIA